MKKFFLLTAALVMLFSMNVFAQDDEDESSDFLEVTLRGGFGIPGGDIKDYGDSLGAKSKLGMGLEIGYFVASDFVAGFNMTYTTFNIDNSVTDTHAEGLTHRLYSPSLYLKYYLPNESNFSPYLKGFVGLDFPKFTTFIANVEGDRYRQISFDPALSYGLGLGLFYYTSDYSGFFFDVTYHKTSSFDTDATYHDDTYIFSNDIQTIDLYFGIRVLFGDE